MYLFNYSFPSFPYLFLAYMFFCIFLDICRVLTLKRLYEQFDALKPRLLIIKGIQETFFWQQGKLNVL